MSDDGPLSPSGPFGRGAEPTRGDPILVRDARGEIHQKIALGGMERPDKFLIVWTCTVDEWRAGTGGDNRIPWPATDLHVGFRFNDVPDDMREDWLDRLLLATRRPHSLLAGKA